MTTPESKIDDLLKKFQRRDVPAVSLALMVGGKLHTGSLGGPPGMLFQACSISKPVAAVGVLKAVQEGAFGLDDDVNDILTIWKLPDPGIGTPVTVRHLLSHTGGINVRSFPGYRHSERRPSIRQILNGDGPSNTTGVRRKAAPGGKPDYSGGGYTILEQIVEQASGRPFADYMKEFIFDPLGMTTASYAAPDPADAAKGNAAKAPVADGWRIFPELAAAGLWCTPSDLVKLAEEVQNAAAGKGKVLSQASAQQMLKLHSGEYGLGFMLATTSGGTQQFHHDGSNEGYLCDMWATVAPGPAVAVMTNSDLGRQVFRYAIPGGFEIAGWPDSSTYAPLKDQAPPRSWAQLHLLNALYDGEYKVTGGSDIVELRGHSWNWRLHLPGRLPVELDVISEVKLTSAYPAISVDMTLHAHRAVRLDITTGSGTIVAERT